MTSFTQMQQCHCHQFQKADGFQFSPTLPIMTAEEIAKVAVEQGGYETPALNDKLYLHYKGYRRIENLEEYKNLKALWLDSNGLQKIENINHLTELRCLFLQRNLLTSMRNLDGLRNLVQLDLSENRITSVEVVSHLPSLATLNLARNALSDAQSITHLSDCAVLSVVDLGHNKLQGKDVVDVLSCVPRLVTLNMVGNPVTTEFPHFRKICIVALKGLRYLDRPVFDMERSIAEAWTEGGRKAELAMKKQWQKKNGRGSERDRGELFQN